MPQLLKHLYFRVLVGIVIGGLIGYLSPNTGVALKPLGDGFIALVKMLIGPVIFFTVVLGIVGAGDLKKVGRVGGKALIYFEVVTTFALIIGLIVVNVMKPGAGLAVATLGKPDISTYVTQGKAMSFVDFATHVVPSS